jgi:hypothetical protein
MGRTVDTHDKIRRIQETALLGEDHKRALILRELLLVSGLFGKAYFGHKASKHEKLRMVRFAAMASRLAKGDKIEEVVRGV